MRVNLLQTRTRKGFLVFKTLQTYRESDGYFKLIYLGAMVGLLAAELTRALH